MAYGDVGPDEATTKRIAELETELAELRKACVLSDEEIYQVLGKALGYPWYKDDQNNFPGTTEKDGICAGDHVAESLAMEAAQRIMELEAKYHKAVQANEKVAMDYKKMSDIAQNNLDSLVKAGNDAIFNKKQWDEWMECAEKAEADRDRLQRLFDATRDDRFMARFLVSSAHATITDFMDFLEHVEAENAGLKASRDRLQSKSNALEAELLRQREIHDNQRATIERQKAENAELRKASQAFVETWRKCQADVYIRKPVTPNAQHAMKSAYEKAKKALGNE